SAAVGVVSVVVGTVAREHAGSGTGTVLALVAATVGETGLAIALASARQWRVVARGGPGAAVARALGGGAGRAAAPPPAAARGWGGWGGRGSGSRRRCWRGWGAPQSRSRGRARVRAPVPSHRCGPGDDRQPARRGRDRCVACARAGPRPRPDVPMGDRVLQRPV